MNTTRLAVLSLLCCVSIPHPAVAAPIKAAYFYGYMSQSHMDSLAAAGFNRAVIKNVGDSLGARQLTEYRGWLDRGRRLGIEVAPSWSLQARSRLNSLPTRRRYTWSGSQVEPDVGCPADSTFWRSVLYDRAKEMLRAFPELRHLMVDLEIYTGTRTHYDSGPCYCPWCQDEYSRAIAGRDPRHIPTREAFQEVQVQNILTTLLRRIVVEHPGIEMSFFDLDLPWSVHKAMCRALATTGLKTTNFTERTYTIAASGVPAARSALQAAGLSAPVIAGLHLKKFSPADLPGITRIVLDVADGCFIFTTYSLWENPAKLSGAYTLPASATAYWKSLGSALLRPELTPASMTLDGATATQGARLGYRFTIHNRGGVPAPPSRWTLRAGGATLASGEAAIPPRDSVVVAGSVAVGLTVGDHQLSLVVDDAAQVLEDDEANNSVVRGIVVVAPPPPVNLPFPSTPVLDNFNRSSGALGSRWTGTTSGAGVSSSRYKPLVSGAVATVWDTEFGADQEAYVTFDDVASSGPKQGLLLKVQGPAVEAGAVEVRYDAVQRKVFAATYTPGRGWEDRGPGIAVKFSDDDVLGARALSNGDVEAFRNGVKLGRWSVAGWAWAAFGGRIGISLNNSSGTRFEDFAGGTLTGAGPAPNRPPIAKATATPASGMAPLVVSLSSAGTVDPDGDALAVSWSLGNGGSSTSANPTASYPTGIHRAILTVTDGRGGVDADTVVVSAIAPGVFPTTPVVDDFSRPNGPLAGRWTGSVAGVQESYGRFKPTTSAAITAIWDGKVMAPDQEAYATFLEAASASPRQGLLLKVQGLMVESGAIEVRYDDVKRQVFVHTFTPGQGWQQRGAGVAVRLVDDDVLGARALSNGDVDVFRNGAKLGRWSVAGWPYAALGGRIGIALENAIETRIDFFGGGSFDLAAARNAMRDPSEAGGGVASLPPALEFAGVTPHPVVSASTVRFGLPQESIARLRAFDVTGRHVATLADGLLSAGWHTLRWDGRGLDGAPLPAGVYLLRLDAGGAGLTRKAVLAR